MSTLLVGDAILNCRLLKNADAHNLKHSTYDLTIGEIFPTGSTKEKFTELKDGEIFFIEPRQTVLVISKEEFQLPSTITGLATLRTTLTKAGLLALNVGIIDPKFNGPISTTLINFSEKTIPIKKGMPFFRVLFFTHADTSEHHHRDENKNRASYMEELQISARTEFARSFLNIPNLDNEFYAVTAWKMIKGLTVKKWWAMAPIYLFIFTLITYIFKNKNYLDHLAQMFKFFKEYIPFV